VSHRLSHAPYSLETISRNDIGTTEVLWLPVRSCRMRFSQTGRDLDDDKDSRNKQCSYGDFFQLLGAVPRGYCTSSTHRDTPRHRLINHEVGLDGFGLL